MNAVQAKVFKPSIYVLEGGNNKKPPVKNNNKTTRWIDPIRSLEDIQKIENYLKSKINQSSGKTRERYARNLLLWVIGTRTGFRVSDLERFTWGLFFDNRGKMYFQTNPQMVIEQKTGKHRAVVCTAKMRDAITKYVELVNPDISPDEYMFQSRNSRFELYDVGIDRKVIDDVTINPDTQEYEIYIKNGRKTQRRIAAVKHRGMTQQQLEKKCEELDRFHISYKIRRFHITEAGIDDIINEVVRENSIEGNYACRTLRKTYAYRMYVEAQNRGKNELEALSIVQAFLGHSNPNITKRYLGIKQQEDYDFMDSINW